jgi:multisubunit Na+/H+ antiporter MnhC subunit
MEFPIIVAVFGLLSIGVLFLLARRALRFVVRLMLVGALVLFLLIGGFAWWWYGANSPASKQSDHRSANARRGNPR